MQYTSRLSPRRNLSLTPAVLYTTNNLGPVNAGAVPSGERACSAHQVQPKQDSSIAMSSKQSLHVHMALSSTADGHQDYRRMHSTAAKSHMLAQQRGVKVFVTVVDGRGGHGQQSRTRTCTTTWGQSISSANLLQLLEGRSRTFSMPACLNITDNRTKGRR